VYIPNCSQTSSFLLVNVILFNSERCVKEESDQAPWLMPDIVVTWKAEIRRLAWAKSSQETISNNGCA
jgi:hypothetical protein